MFVNLLFFPCCDALTSSNTAPVLTTVRTLIAGIATVCRMDGNSPLRSYYPLNTGFRYQEPGKTRPLYDTSNQIENKNFSVYIQDKKHGKRPARGLKYSTR